ncbi:hypothetical protein SVA_1211 [Sulfurifustis variabilis]|uniref:Uncharacterized protein n=1 Tax=Sulfurifustis variabilis TaxID=1675686 RepID=A0A1B4V2L8_9GAMM|nr:hypothetical protein [Sulfurifustis variabilis]BAU47786.1 hypothetical protein SVA_1211 [Sulfurifustis variabilis]
MAQKDGGGTIAVIVGVALAAVLLKTCQDDPAMRGHVIRAARSGMNSFAGLVGVILVLFGGGGAILLLKEAISGGSPFDEWAWRFAIAVGVGLFGLWVISHVS